MLKPGITIVSLLLLLSGCSTYEGGFKLPGVYRIDIQQGNVIEQEMLDKLKPGMDQNQVRFIMGTPAMVDPFHNDRWDYVYTFSKGGAQREQRHVILYFENDKLAYVDGDVVTGLRKPPTEFLKERKSVEVPLKDRKNKSIIGKMIEALPFVGDDDDITAKKDTDTSKTDPNDVSQPAGVGKEINELP